MYEWSAGCPGDCPWPLVQCPIGGSQLCSGKGRCLSTQGRCECFAPFRGPTCSLCADGYIGSAGSCSRYVRIALPYIILQNRAASINVRPISSPSNNVLPSLTTSPLCPQN